MSIKKEYECLPLNLTFFSSVALRKEPHMLRFSPAVIGDLMQSSSPSQITDLSSSVTDCTLNNSTKL